jgi:NTE family protein
MFESIALGGGGVRGGIMVGGLIALEKYQPLVFPKGIYGSSAGAVIATCLAYKIPIKAIQHMFATDYNLSSVIPSINLTSIMSFTQNKGMFAMDAFTQSVIKAFDGQGIDLRNAVIDDTPQKLYILTSNLTTRRASLLTGSVSILDALRASCCLPFIFRPQIIYNNVHVDGGVYTHILHKIAPPDCLVFHISRADLNINPERLKKMTLADYSATLYEASRIDTISENVLWFTNDEIALMQELTEANKQQLFEQGIEQGSRFFAKRFPEILS